MTARPWPAIAAGTAAWAPAFWVASFLAAGSPGAASAVAAVGAVTVVFIVVHLGADRPPGAVVFVAALTSLATGALLLVLGGVSGNVVPAVMLPVLMPGVGVLRVLAPSGDPRHVGGRVVALAAAGILAVGIAVVDVSVWVLVAPLLPLPALGFADRVVRLSAGT